MSDSVRVEMVGADRLARTIHAAANRLDREVGGANNDIARYVQSRARVLAPRLTGRLRSSITSATDSKGAEVGTTLVYGAVQEFGWPGHGIEPQRYLARAAQASRPRATAAYVRAAQQSVSGIKGA